MGYLKKEYIVTHDNSFETAICERTTTLDLRLIAIYLSKINPYDPETKKVSFTLKEYSKIADLKRCDIRSLKESADRLVNSSVCVDREDGGFKTISIFEEFELKQADGDWIVSLECTGKIAPYFFDLKKNFTQYELWNILNLCKRNHQQMYRILKQYEKISGISFTVSELKFRLGLANRYSEYKIFRRDVLEKCKQALSEKTDIRFDYEPIRKGRKVHAIKFTIHKNTPPGNKPLLSEFVAEMATESSIALDQNDDQDSLGDGFQVSASGQARTYSDPDVIFFAEACNNEFSEAEMNRLIDALRRRVTPKSNAYATIEFERFHVLQTAYLEMCARPKVYSRVNYLLKILEPKDPATT